MKKTGAFLALILLAGGILGAQNVFPAYNGFWDRGKKISVLDVLGYYPDRIPYLRNEIYARYGRAFVTPAYQDYFNSQGWYSIRRNYTDAWLSEADKYNAELLRSLEQAPSAAGVFELLARIVEYRGSGKVLSFSLSYVMKAEMNAYFSVYGYSYHDDDNESPYLVIGDWVILYRGESSSRLYDVEACRLNHETREITAYAAGRTTDTILDPLIAAQDELRGELRSRLGLR